MSALLAWIGILVLGLILFLNLGSSRTQDPDCAIDGSASGVDGCTGPQAQLPSPASAAPGWEPVNVNGVYGVIVAPDDVNDFGLGSGAALETWKPDIADIEDAETALFVEQGSLGHYRQYAGYVEDGDRKIHINGFCDAFGSNWYQQEVIVEDGGECFFQATYNAENGELEQFTFNGSA